MSRKPANGVEEWYLRERGIQPATLERCHVTTTNSEARWPVGKREKIRSGFFPGEERKFRYSEKGDFDLWYLPVKSGEITDPVIVCEGETDAMRLWQDGGAQLYGQVAAMPGVDAFTSQAADRLLKRAGKATIYFVLDNDKAENGGGDGDSGWDPHTKQVSSRQVDDAWKRIKTYIPKARRIYLPDGYKDICEYLNIYSVKDFNEFVVNAEARYNYDALDLTQRTEGPDYLWNDIVPRGQFVLLQGDSNVGKSMLYQALAVAMANGDDMFLGKKLQPTRGGRVFIVDEENHEDEVRARFEKLGLKPENQKRLRIVSQRGVRIDLDSDKLFEDVSNFNPDLVVLDSFIRLHMQDENSAQAVSGMFNQSVLPISRQLGAAVILLHHTNRSDSGDSRKKTRGSTDIMASVDMAWELLDVQSDMPGKVYKRLSRFKARGTAVKKDVFFQFEDNETGGIDFPLLTSVGDVL